MKWDGPTIAALGEPFRCMDDAGCVLATLRWVQSAHLGSGAYMDNSGEVCEQNFAKAVRAVERLVAGQPIESDEPQTKLQFGEKR